MRLILSPVRRKDPIKWGGCLPIWTERRRSSEIRRFISRLGNGWRGDRRYEEWTGGHGHHARVHHPGHARAPGDGGVKGDPAPRPDGRAARQRCGQLGRDAGGDRCQLPVGARRDGPSHLYSQRNPVSIRRPCPGARVVPMRIMLHRRLLHRHDSDRSACGHEPGSDLSGRIRHLSSRSAPTGFRAPYDPGQRRRRRCQAGASVRRRCCPGQHDLGPGSSAGARAVHTQSGTPHAASVRVR
jgi:hypothetical protein